MLVETIVLTTLSAATAAFVQPEAASAPEMPLKRPWHKPAAGGQTLL
jgi:hypothetical protein